MAYMYVLYVIYVDVGVSIDFSKNRLDFNFQCKVLSMTIYANQNLIFYV